MATKKEKIQKLNDKNSTASEVADGTTNATTPAAANKNTSAADLTEAERKRRAAKIAIPCAKIASALVMIIILLTVIRPASPIQYLIVSGCAIIPLVLFGAQKLFRLDLPLGVDITVTAFLILAADIGSGGGLYGITDFYDLIVHGFFGLASGIVLMYLWNMRLGRPTALGVVCIFLMTMGFAALWECWEFFADSVMGLDEQAVIGCMRAGLSPLFDTMTDILITAAGAAVFCALYLADVKSGGKIFALAKKPNRGKK